MQTHVTHVLTTAWSGDIHRVWTYLWLWLWDKKVRQMAVSAADCLRARPWLTLAVLSTGLLVNGSNFGA